MMLYLASNSPRRRQLIALGGWAAQIVPVEIDERPFLGELPGDYVLRMAESKARAAEFIFPASGVVIAADTAVVNTENDHVELLGKPIDGSDAEAMLRKLRGKIHQVFTALAIFMVKDGILRTDCCVTDVPMRNYSDEEMAAYIHTGDPLDKAGAYAIQHADFHPVSTLDGCYANVMGLPLCHLTRNLAAVGVQPNSDVPAACQSALQYQCSCFPQVLSGKI
jgi:septum formation protein